MIDGMIDTEPMAMTLTEQTHRELREEDGVHAVGIAVTG
jgi:hypothetical protein